VPYLAQLEDITPVHGIANIKLLSTWTSVGFAQFSLGYDQNGSSPQHNHLTLMVKFPASTLSRHFTYGKSPFFFFKGLNPP
jgi:hypothetical protein